MSTASPCRSICVLDPVTGWCIGCGRTSAEIGGWLAMSDAAKTAVNVSLPERLKTMTSRNMRRGGPRARQASR